MIRLFLSLLFCWALLPAAQAAPNFVILVGDGIGRDWMSCYSSCLLYTSDAADE